MSNLGTLVVVGGPGGGNLFIINVFEIFDNKRTILGGCVIVAAVALTVRLSGRNDFSEGLVQAFT